MVRRYINLDRESAFYVKPLQGAPQPFRRFADRTSCSWSRSRSGGARVRKMVVDLSAHAFNLLRDRGGKLRLSGIVNAARFMRENRQRSFQAMSEIARFRLCAPDRLFTMLE